MSSEFFKLAPLYCFSYTDASMTQAPALRDYQSACLRTVRERYQQGTRRQLICLPTGTGKTVIFASFPSFFKMKKKMLVLAHREELLEQARDKLKHANPGLQVEIEQAGRRADPASDVVVASVPSLGRKDSGRLSRFDPEDFYLVVVDEAHHAISSTYLRIFKKLGLLKPDTSKLLVGFTATPKRGDGQGLNKVFQEITFSRTLPEMIEGGYLAPVSGYRVETSIDLSGVKLRMGDFITSQLSLAVNNDARNAIIIDVYKKYLAGRQTLCFCVDVEHVHALETTFRKAGIPSAAITGATERERRREILHDFSRGRIKVVTNCMVLTEGYDESSVEGIILARPTRSSLLYTQMVGRATRLHEGKEKAVIIDMVDITKDHGLVTLPGLFGLSDKFDLEGHTTNEVRKALDWVERKRAWVRADQATSITDLRYRCRSVDLLELRLPPELEKAASLAWTGLGPKGYCLNLAGGEALLLSTSILGRWEVTLRNPFGEEVLSQFEELDSAVRMAEEYVQESKADSLGLVKLGTSWRSQPATARQLQLLEKLKIELPRELTKGQASHLIAMLKS